MEIQIQKRFLVAILAACLTLGLLPALPLAAYATDTSTVSQPMALGSNGIKSRDITANYDVPSGSPLDASVNSEGDTIVLGSYSHNGNKYPVSWVTLNKDGTKALMFSEYLLGESIFKESSTGSYANSTLNTAMENLYSTDLGLTSNEKEIILDTTLSGDSMADVSSGLTDLTGQKLFAVSYYYASLSSESRDTRYPVGEFFTHIGYGTDLAKGRQIYSPETIETGSYWWLRYTANLLTKAAGDFTQAYAAESATGTISENEFLSVTETAGIRPAYYLDLSQVLFTSAAVDGKAAYTNESSPTLELLTGTTPTEWKLTLLDDTRDFTVVGDAKVEGDIVSFDYTGAKLGDNEFISIMIVDEANNISHYAKVSKVEATDGSASFTLPAEFAGSESLTVQVFNEQANGNNNTDLSSAFVNLTINLSKSTVDFDPNGGMGSMPSITIPTGNSITLPESGFTAPEGYQFKSWEIDGVVYAPDSTYFVNANTIVKAVWEPISSSEGTTSPSEGTTLPKTGDNISLPLLVCIIALAASSIILTTGKLKNQLSR